MSTSYLVRNLCGFCRVAFWFVLLILISSLGSEIFTKDGNIGPISGTHHSKGYALPVKLQLTVNDSIVNYKSNSSNGSAHYRKSFAENELAYSRIDSLSKQPGFSKSVNKNIIKIRNHEDKSYYELTNSIIATEADVYVKSKSFWLEALLFLKSYVALISLVLIFYFLKEIFKTLKSGMEFRLQLSNKVRKLGVVLTFLVFFKLLLSFIFHLYFDVITVLTSIENEIIANPTNVLIYPRLDFNLLMFIVGLSLIILSTLLKEGNRIQQENDLTI